MGKEKALVVQPDEPFPTSLKKNDDVLVDLGGFVDERIIGVLEQSKQIIVPTLGSYLSFGWSGGNASRKSQNSIKKLSLS